mgnify:CR=1 FL=1
MESFLGGIVICGFPYAPRGYALCNGQNIPLWQNTALFSLLANNYGGNGTSNFSLPDLRGTVPIHPDNQTIMRGDRGGRESTVLFPQHAPAHTHGMAASTGTGATSPAGTYPGASGNYDAGPSNGVMSPLTISEAGGMAPVNLMKPYTVMNFLICTNGVFPPRW